MKLSWKLSFVAEIAVPPLPLCFIKVVYLKLFRWNLLFDSQNTLSLNCLRFFSFQSEGPLKQRTTLLP